MTRSQLLRSLACSHAGCARRVYQIGNGEIEGIRSVMSSAKLLSILCSSAKMRREELLFTLDKAEPDGPGDNLCSLKEALTIQAHSQIRKD